MNFKLRKISKLNIAMSVVICAVLFFCFCSRPCVVQAADEAFDYNGIHYANYICKSGYWYSQSSLKGSYCHGDCKTGDGDSWIHGNIGDYVSSWNHFVSTNYPDYTGDFLKTFDLYVVAVECKSGNEFWISNYYYFTPKGTIACMQDGFRFDELGAKYIYFKTPKDGQKILCVGNKSSLESNTSCYHDRIGFYPVYDGYYNSNQNINYSSMTSSSYYGGNVFAKMDADSFSGRYSFAFTNIAMVGSDLAAGAKSFFAGDTSVATNAHPEWTGDPDGNNTTAGKKIGCDSIYWDDMSCSVSSVGSSKYAFKFDYTYSCSDLVNYPSDCYVKVVYNADIRYQDGKGRVKSNSFSQEDLYSLAKHPNSFVNSNLYINSGLIDSAGSSGYNKLLELTDGLVGLFGHVDLDLESNTDIIVKNAKLYVTVFLYEFDHDEELPGMRADYFENSNLSSDVRSFSFDLFTLKEDTSGTKVKPTVSTKDVVDDDGKVVGKKVTDAVVNDDDGKTVVNITIDNSNKVEDKNNNVNVPVNGGGGSGDSDDKNTTSFWKYITAFTAFINALLNADKGLFKVIAAYFSFIPGEFWDVTLGGIVVVIVLSIYRLAKKG